MVLNLPDATHFNITVPCVVLTPETIKLFSLLLHNNKFAVINVVQLFLEIEICQRWHDPQVEDHWSRGRPPRIPGLGHFQTMALSGRMEGAGSSMRPRGRREGD